MMVPVSDAMSGFPRRIGSLLPAPERHPSTARLAPWPGRLLTILAMALVAAGSRDAVAQAADADDTGSDSSAAASPGDGGSDQSIAPAESGQSLFLKSEEGCMSLQKSTFRVPKGQTHKGDVYFLGRDVVVAGTLDGDLFALGTTTDVPGSVTQDLNAAGSIISVSGDVGDDARVLGSVVTISGKIAGDLIVMAGTVRILPGASIGGRTLVGGGDISLAGTYGHSIQAGGGRVEFAGHAESDVRVESDVLEFGETAHINGNLTYTAREELESLRGTGASARKLVSGTVSFVPKAPHKRSSGHRLGFYYLFKIWSLVTSLVVGWILIAAAGGAARSVLRAAQTDTLKSLGLGLIGHIFLPFAGLILVVLCLTAPAGILVLVGWAVLFYLAKIAVGLALGDGLLRRIGLSPSPYLSLVVGMIPIWLLVMVPFLGIFVYWVIVPIFGIGAILIGLREHARRSGGSPAGTVPAVAAV